ALWEPMMHGRVAQILAHTRPISAIRYAPDGRTLATASWDKSVTLWSNFGKDAEGKTLCGHTDIVAGCLFFPDGTKLVSWSHDTTLRIWDVCWAREMACLKGHQERITAAGVSSDGILALSASRDRVLNLWDLSGRNVVRSRTLSAEVRACFFLSD